MSVFRDARRLSSSVFLGALMASVRSIVVLRLLGPVLIGAWKTALLVDTVGEIARSGILRGMSIRVPVLIGEGDREDADRTAAASGGFLVWLGVALAAAIFGGSFLAHDANVRLSLQFLAYAVGIGQPYYFIRELAGTHHRFAIRSKEELLRCVIDLVGAVVLCKFLGLTGLGLATCAATTFGAVYYLRKQPIPFRLFPSREKLRELMKIGVPFSITEAGYDLLRRVDIWVIAMLAGPTAVGYYGLSLLILDFATVLSQKGVAQVLSPHMLTRFGQTKSHSDIAMFYEIPARLFCYVLPPLIGAGTFLIAIFAHLLLPQFNAGIGAAQVTLWTMLFIALHFSINSYFAAANLIPKIIRMLGWMIGIAFAAQFASMKLGFGIEGAAWCTLGTSAAWAGVELFVARTSCGESKISALAFIASLFLPLVVAIVLRALVNVMPLPVLNGSVLEPVARMGFFLLFYLPVLIGYELRFSMLRSVQRAM